MFVSKLSVKKNIIFLTFSKQLGYLAAVIFKIAIRLLLTSLEFDKQTGRKKEHIVHLSR